MLFRTASSESLAELQIRSSERGAAVLEPQSLTYYLSLSAPCVKDSSDPHTHSVCLVAYTILAIAFVSSGFTTGGSAVSGAARLVQLLLSVAAINSKKRLHQPLRLQPQFAAHFHST